MTVREMKRLPAEELSRWGETELSELCRALQGAITEFNLPGRLSVDNKGTTELTVSVSEWQGYSLDLIETERRTIGRSMMVPAWQLTRWNHIAASRWEPENVVDVPVSVHRSTWDAVVALVNAMREIEVAAWTEDITNLH